MAAISDGSVEVRVDSRFNNFKEFQHILNQRKDTIGERWVKGKDVRTVAYANSKIKNTALHFRADFEYSRIEMVCIHGGVFKSRGEKNNTSTHKLKCPAKIILVAKRDINKMVVTHCDLTHNHDLYLPTDFQYAPDRAFTPEEETTVRELLKLGVVAQKIKEHTEQTYNKQVSCRMIHSIRKKAVQEERKGLSVEQETWDILDDMMANDPEAQFSVHGDETSNELIFILFQTGGMRRIMQSYPEILCIDGTYCLNNLRLPLYVFLSIDGDNCGQAVGYAIVRNETKSTLSLLFKRFVEMNACSPKTIVVDKDASEIASIREVLPQADIVLCRFHVATSFKDAAAKHAPPQQKDEIHALLRKMLYSTTETGFQTALNSLPEGQLKTYFIKNWLPHKGSWAQYLTQKILTYGNKTNNFVERANRKLKTVSGHRSSIPGLIKALLNLNKQEKEKLRLKLKELSIKRKVHKLPEGVLRADVARIDEILTPHAAGLVRGELEKLEKIKEKIGIFKEEQVVVVRDNDEVKTFDLSEGKCSCLLNVESGLPCKHLLALRKACDKDLIDSVPHHWKLDSYFACLGSTLPPRTIPVSTERTRQPKTKSEVEKRREAESICKSLLSIIVCCSQEEFSQRCQVLKDLEEKWRRGKYAEVVETDGRYIATPRGRFVNANALQTEVRGRDYDGELEVVEGTSGEAGVGWSGDDGELEGTSGEAGVGRSGDDGELEGTSGEAGVGRSGDDGELEVHVEGTSGVGRSGNDGELEGTSGEAGVGRSGDDGELEVHVEGTSGVGRSGNDGELEGTSGEAGVGRSGDDGELEVHVEGTSGVGRSGNDGELEGTSGEAGVGRSGDDGELEVHVEGTSGVGRSGNDGELEGTSGEAGVGRSGDDGELEVHVEGTSGVGRSGNDGELEGTSGEAGVGRSGDDGELEVHVEGTSGVGRSGNDGELEGTSGEAGVGRSGNDGELEGKASTFIPFTFPSRIIGRGRPKGAGKTSGHIKKKSVKVKKKRFRDDDEEDVTVGIGEELVANEFDFVVSNEVDCETETQDEVLYSGLPVERNPCAKRAKTMASNVNKSVTFTPVCGDDHAYISIDEKRSHSNDSNDVCGVCNKCDPPKSLSKKETKWIDCDVCEVWYHFVCLPKAVRNKGASLICMRCL